MPNFHSRASLKKLLEEKHAKEAAELLKRGEESRARLEELLEAKRQREEEEHAKEIEKMKADAPGKNKDAQDDWLCGLGFPPKLSNASFATFDKAGKEKTVELAREYCRAFLDGGGDQIYGIVLSSQKYGVGKTHLLHAIATEIIRNTPAVRFMDTVTYYTRDGKPVIKPGDPRYAYGNNPVFYMNEVDMLTRIRATYNRDSQENELRVFAELNKAELLIIDDVGKVKPQDLSFVQQVYYRLVEYRWGEEKHIALATNLVGDDLEKFVGGAVASRLAEMTQGKYFITMSGEDYRLKGIKNNAK